MSLLSLLINLNASFINQSIQFLKRKRKKSDRKLLNGMYLVCIKIVIYWKLNLVENNIAYNLNLAVAFIQSDLQSLYISEVARLWSN